MFLPLTNVCDFIQITQRIRKYVYITFLQTILNILERPVSNSKKFYAFSNLNNMKLAYDVQNIKAYHDC